MSTIAERFKEIRVNKGIRSQAALADKLGVKRQAIEILKVVIIIPQLKQYVN